jgi:nicotinate-nucleotide--dimethylbenzimidazole phosphoribosyltransferase
MSLYHNTLKDIKGLDRAAMEKARAHQDRLTKPRGSLGRLEELAIKIAGIRSEPHPKLKRKRVVVFAGDHGVVDEGVSAYPQDVTAQMVLNFLSGGAGINAIAGCVGAEVEVVDVGVDFDFPELNGLVAEKIRRGTRNLARGPAMTTEETIMALEVGIERANFARKKGIELIAGGDMGIGNTTSATALFCAYLGLPPLKVAGPGAGLKPEQVRHKARVIAKALKINWAALSDPLETLAALGGLEIAGLAGLYLGAAKNRMVALVDGFIATAGALAAIKLCPVLKHHLIFSHLSEEPGHTLVLKKMGVRPLLSLDLRLGEGTGACLAMALIDAALACHNQMATFASAGVSEKA